MKKMFFLALMLLGTTGVFASSQTFETKKPKIKEADILSSQLVVDVSKKESLTEQTVMEVQSVEITTSCGAVVVLSWDDDFVNPTLGQIIQIAIAIDAFLCG